MASDYLAPGGRQRSTNQETPKEADRVDCSDKLAASSAIPDPPPLCFAIDPDADRGCFNEAPNTSASSVAPGQCGPDELATTPGHTVTDDLSDVSAAHIDFTAVSTTLSGETLTAVFQLSDVPETLTFDRIGIRPRVLEYCWMISIDIDYEPEQGSAEFDYTLTAAHSVLPSDSGKNVAAPIEAKLESNTWERDGDRFAFLADAIVELSSQANTITLVGDIPGITSEARLVFEAYDYYDGSDRVACHVPSAGE